MIVRLCSQYGEGEVAPFYRYLHDYWELERVLGCFEKLWSHSTSTSHRRSIDVPSTRNLDGIKIYKISKIIKISSIFSKNRYKFCLKHFFENLSCAFFIGMILYLKRAFPETLEARKCFGNLFGNHNMLKKCDFLAQIAKTWNLLWKKNGAFRAALNVSE